MTGHFSIIIRAVLRVLYINGEQELSWHFKPSY
jgi:hypothetical protein